MNGRVLIIAGSDSGGGAGVQADIKTVTALGGYAATAITALTAQNTQGVFGVVGVEPGFIRQQIDVVLNDIGADCLKTGMLHNSEVILTVVSALKENAAGIPLVVDPVMVAKGGDSLLTADAEATLKKCLLPMASLITPNIFEARRLTGMEIADPDAMPDAARELLSMGPQAVLLKGGHLGGPVIHDFFLSHEESRLITHPRIETRNVHGAGCTLASATAAGIAQKMNYREAAERACDYVHNAITHAPGFGQGYGPLNHAYPLER